MSVLFDVMFMSVMSLFVPGALYLYSFFVAICSVPLIMVPVCFFIDLPVRSVVPVGFVQGFASMGFSDGVFSVVVFDPPDMLSHEVLPRADGLTWYAFM
jgi:hypothetical protein